MKINLPTKITVARILLIPIFAALYLIPDPTCQLAATVVFIVAALTDWLDGYLARRNNMVTNLGKFLDPVADKVLVACALILAVFYMPTEGALGWSRYAIVICTVIIVSRELIITCFRTIAATKNVIMAADRLGKMKTVFQLIGLILLLPYNAIFTFSEGAGAVFLSGGIAFLQMATAFTILSAVNYIHKNRHVLGEKGTDGEKEEKEEKEA
ncbi:MAG: CDP-diacylglycerol--glycerol-3-phosphate 3-phosphatidyltransferase [Clostridiales bacterium]|jgi:CDP-diacylglycerol--glycerol-3-phosphate 3-phosphatidyltransferase|nr:CDP-diacylglycerol--glycerol-3-phosphate 3-phosphatidyltransferase [Clostridiales bacterium]